MGSEAGQAPGSVRKCGLLGPRLVTREKHVQLRDARGAVLSAQAQVVPQLLGVLLAALEQLEPRNAWLRGVRTRFSVEPHGTHTHTETICSRPRPNTQSLPLPLQTHPASQGDREGGSSQMLYWGLFVVTRLYVK